MSAITSNLKIKVKAINQVSILVNDIQRVAENYWTKLGIGPWEIFSIKTSEDFKGNYLGKSSSYGYKYGICQCGQCSLKLIQPTDGESIFSNYISNLQTLIS